MEIIIRQLVKDGFKKITIAVNHLAELMMAFFQDGRKWNIEIDYSIEDEPLGTIGPLTLINDLPDNFLVMNGDILCDISYSKIMNFHMSNKNELTICSYKRNSKIDFGVLEVNERNEIIEFREKPEFNFLVSTGIYCISKSIINSLTTNSFYGFDQLMIDGIKANKRIISYSYDGFWLDIGRPDDYDYCNENYDLIKKMFLS